MYLIFFLAMAAALSEGVGIALLLPLLAALDVGLGASTGTPPALDWFLEIVGLHGSLIGILLLIGGAFLLKGLIVFTYAAYGGYLQAHLVKELKGRMFRACSKMRYDYYVSRSTGHFVNLITSQINAFNSAFVNYRGFVVNSIKALTYLGVALVLAWQFGVMAMIAGLIMIACFRRLNVHVRELSRKTSREAGILNKLLVQAVQAFKYLAATNSMERLERGVDSSVHRMTHYEINQQIWQAFTGSLTEPLTVAMILAIIVMQVAWLDQPLAPIVVSILLFYRGMTALLTVQSQWQSTMSQIGAVEMVEAEFEALAKHREAGGDNHIGPLTNEIRFNGVNFSYHAEQGDVLKDISLVIPACSTVAIVGESGAGKSTLVDLLTLMLKPRSGSVAIDGVPGTEVNLASWRSQIGYVSQETVIFDDTIAANIAMADISPSDGETLARVREAAKQAQIADFIDTLPNGYMTSVGDRGVRLSGGQRQRLFIARELYRQPRLLILDEATSALDSESELGIRASIDALHGRMAVVMIAHRLATIRNSDWIFVFAGGRIVEQGTYETLRERGDTRFSRMVELQAL